MDLAQILAFLVVAMVAGAAAASVLSGRRKQIRYSALRSLLIGGIGAFVGQIVFDLLNINLPEILTGELTIADIVIAFFGALLVILIVEGIRR